MNKYSIMGLALTAGIFCGAPSSVSATVIVSATDNGWYNSSGVHVTDNTNTYTGLSNLLQYRSWYLFNVGSNLLTSAAITFVGGNGYFQTDTGTEALAIFDFLGSTDALKNGTGGVAAFTDLGSGNVLGTHSITAAPSTSMPQFTVDLGQAFITQYNGLVGTSGAQIAVGGALTTIGGTQPQAFWSGSQTLTAASLSIEEGIQAAVPEPATWAMMLLGFGFVGGAMRSAKRRSRVTFSFA